MNWVVLRFPCDMKTAARAEKVLEQLNEGLPPEVREPDTPRNFMQPMPVTPAESKIQPEFGYSFVQGFVARADERNRLTDCSRLAFKCSPSNASH